ncbi:uncharacterized protein DEA37_0005118 [Paragonimus westermani]|uniref:BHLH domain-containing protein n=1 Tax=Paragonimus westermani TaxID=34504 RepID=A0A5J4NMP9_9TREM|nr:uncharacterized protein DEA37_0005118 [Paragonimus westermani]
MMYNGNRPSSFGQLVITKNEATIRSDNTYGQVVDPKLNTSRTKIPTKKVHETERTGRLKLRRARANARERTRMHGLNSALDVLRKHIPLSTIPVETVSSCKSLRILTDNLPPLHPGMGLATESPACGAQNQVDFDRSIVLKSGFRNYKKRLPGEALVIGSASQKVNRPGGLEMSVVWRDLLDRQQWYHIGKKRQECVEHFKKKIIIESRKTLRVVGPSNVPLLVHKHDIPGNP